MSTQKLVATWNELQEEVVEAGTTTFKRHWDRYMERNGLEGYEPNTGKWN